MGRRKSKPATRRMEAERMARLRAAYEAEAAAGPRLDDFWTPREITGNLYVLAYCAEFFTGQYGTPETFN